MRNARKEFLSAIIFIVTNVVIAALCFAVYYLVNNLGILRPLLWEVGIYLFACLLLIQLKKKYPSKPIKILCRVFFLPVTLLELTATLAIPVLSIQLTLLLYLAFSFILPFVFFRISEQNQLIHLEPDTWVYLITTSGVICAFVFYSHIRYLVYKLLPFKKPEGENAEQIGLLDLNNYLLSENNIRLVIFGLYFLALIVINVGIMEERSIFRDPGIDRAVLNSLLTFIAFDRFLSAHAKTEFRFSNLLTIFRKFVSQVFGR